MAKYDYEAINEEILSHKLSETIGRFCRLQNEGAGRKKCCCPFHHEKTPSFFLDDIKGLWHCFGCGESGNVFTFVKKIKSCDFKQAVDDLCSFFSIDRSQFVVKSEDEQAINAGEQFAKTMDFTVKYFEDCLAGDENAKSYLYDIRELNDATLKEFNFGLADSDKQKLLALGKENGINENNFIDSGILKKKDDSTGDSYLFFRDRIIIPIRNERGRVVAFGGRIYKDGDNGAKYLNSSENIFFKKKRILFNLDKAKKFLDRDNVLIVVEGYMDAISLWQFGFKTAIAPLGTSITYEHLAKIFSYCKEPIFLFDSDEAGKKALVRACEMIFPILKVGFIPKFCYLSGAKDVDEFLKKYTREDLQEQINNARELQDFIFEMKSKSYNLDDPNHKGMFQKEIFDLVASIGDENLQRVFKEHFRQKIFFDRKSMPNFNKKKDHQNCQSAVGEFTKSESLDFLEKQIIAILLIENFKKKDEYWLESIVSKLSKKNQSLFYKLKEKDVNERKAFLQKYQNKNQEFYDVSRIDDFLLSLEIKKVETSNLSQSIKMNEIQKLLDKKKHTILKSFDGYDEI